MKISIITATYNSSATIRDTLESVASQTFENIEHIIVDGLSSDNTLEIVNEYCHVAKVIAEKDKGIYDAMNKGIKLANGDIIGILNSDDIFASDDIIANIVSAFKKDDTIDAVYGNISYFKTEEPQKIVRYWKSKPYYTTFFEDGNVPPHPTLYVKSNIYQKVGLFNIYFKISADYDLMLRMLKIHQIKSHYINQDIVKMRIGGTSTAGINSLIISFNEVKKSWKVNNLERPYLFLFKRYIMKLIQLIQK